MYNITSNIYNITLQLSENNFNGMHNVRPNMGFYACDK